MSAFFSVGITICCKCYEERAPYFASWYYGSPEFPLDLTLPFLTLRVLQFLDIDVSTGIHCGLSPLKHRPLLSFLAQEKRVSKLEHVGC